MAISAVITLSAASCTQGQTVVAKVVVSNSAAYDVNVLNIKPTMIFTGNTAAKDGASFGANDVPLSQGFNATVPASSSANFFFSLAPYETSLKEDDTGSGTYSVSCLISCDDSSLTTPTAALLTVHPVLPIF